MPLAFPRGAAIGLPVVGSISHLESYQIEIVPHGKLQQVKIVLHGKLCCTQSKFLKLVSKWRNVPPKAFISFPSKVRPAKVCLLLQGLKVVVRFWASIGETTPLLCELLSNCPDAKTEAESYLENSQCLAWYGKVPIRNNPQVPWKVLKSEQRGIYQLHIIRECPALRRLGSGGIRP